ncbi:hypothetical protein MHU86_10853 [Fragilaria crotonensis]|nr:hypothetical protein MHU86_10853 [Fragilaria crotonensis]
MAPTVNTGIPTGHPDTWTDFYKKNGADNGPFQTLLETNAAEMARLTRSHLHNTGKLTETVTGSDHGNMVLVPGGKGTMRIIHHGFACNTPAGFTLVFAHGNLDDSTTFKTVNRDEMVAPAIARQGAGGEVAEALPPSFAPSLESMMGAESPTEFRDLEPEDNAILESYPNHCLINTNIFSEVKGAKQISSKDLAFNLVEAFQLSVVDDDEISVEREAEAAGLENILAILWASENGLLKEIRLDDVPESAMMSHLIRGVKQKLTGRTAAGSGREEAMRSAGATPREGTPIEDRANATSMEMMAASSQSMVALLNRFQEGSEADRQRKESEKSILKTMGPTQRELFTSLCTRRMNEAPPCPPSCSISQPARPPRKQSI